MKKRCEWCEEEFETKRSRFCSKSCSAKWRVAAGKQAPWTPERRARVSEAVKAWHAKNPHVAEHARDRMLVKNPMREETTRRKMSSTLKRIGYGPKVRGGNGKGPTVAEVRVLDLFPRAEWNLVIRTKGAEGDNLPNHYKVDVAFPKEKLAVEIDGASHNALQRQDQDRKKETALRSLGWTVLRFTNQEVMSAPDHVGFTISECLGTLRMSSQG